MFASGPRWSQGVRNWRATNPRTGGRPTQELVGKQAKTGGRPIRKCSLRFLAVSGGLLAAPCGFWLLLAAPGCSWQVLAVRGCYWRFLALTATAQGRLSCCRAVFGGRSVVFHSTLPTWYRKLLLTPYVFSKTVSKTVR